MTDNIQITIKEGNRTVKLRLPPRNELLESSLKILNKEQEFHKRVSEREEEEFRHRLPHYISSSILKKDKEFRDTFIRAGEAFDDISCNDFKIPNKIEVSSGAKIILDKRKWEKILNTEFGRFSEIIHKNVEMVIVHIASKIPDDDKTNIADDLARQFPNIPTKRFITDGSHRTTLVEVMLFGTDFHRIDLEDSC